MVRFVVGAGAFALLALGVVGLFGVLVRWEAQIAGIDNPSDVQSLGALGDFLNVRYGLPVAVIAGLIGGVITFMLDRISTRQGEVDILNFAEEKSETITACFRPFAESVIKAFGFARKVQLEQTAAAQAVAENDPKAPFEKVRAHFCEHAEGTVAEFRDELKDLRDDAQAVWLNSYSILVAEHGLNARPTHADRLEELAQLGLETEAAGRMGLLGPEASFFDAAPKMIISQLDRLIQDLTVERAFNVLYQLPPNGLRLMDVAGAIAGGQFCALKQPRKLADGRVCIGYFLNYGAAYFLMLVHALPRRQDVAELIDQLLDRRSKIARVFLEQAGPDWSLYTFTDDWIDGFNDYDRPYAFAYATVREGDRVYSEHYDPMVHGRSK